MLSERIPSLSSVSHGVKSIIASIRTAKNAFVAHFGSIREARGVTVIEVSRFRLVATHVNAAAGKMIAPPDVGIDKLAFFSDGSAPYVILGLAQHVVVPGEGRIAANSGRVVLYYEGQDIQKAHVQCGSAGVDTHLARALCTALAP